MVDYDAIVIGSGAGGLAAALCLARAGKRVLVAEQHYLPGGWCHSFNLGGYHFSPGVHYIGDLGPGGFMREAYEGLGVANDLPFLELNPDGFDHIIVGDERFDVPRGKKDFANRLKARFPSEAVGIDDFMNTIEAMGGELVQLLKGGRRRDLLTMPWRAPLTARFATTSLERFLDRYTQDPRLRAILSIQAGDHGMAPSRAPMAMHGFVLAHYFNGAFYPKGGARSIPRAFIRQIREHGGEIRVKTAVKRILVEGYGPWRRAVGVELADGTTLRANTVISNADPHRTFNMIDDYYQSRKMKRKLGATSYGVSALSLFFAVDMDLKAMGYDSGNYWYARTPSIESTYTFARRPHLDGTEVMPGVFLTITTLKDPSKRKDGLHTCEAFCIVSYDAFAKWAHTKHGERPDDYKAFKSALSERMFEALENIVPGIRKHVVYSELGTPLTNRFYVGATQGNLYGIEKSWRQIGPMAFPIRTPLNGLYMCGASTLGHGVSGATMSGIRAAEIALGCSRDAFYDSRGQHLEIYPSDHPETWPTHVRPPTPASSPEQNMSALPDVSAVC
ncbi:MAG: NAD(P)/FAD-dependent oxidoreductase [Proteobacteria bacterium]|jgi:all-trans-retinol 13,14-reductase|nr:NAD(P)/FAD-dependent oxidoreductase [Pseudomonadota bacterium]